MFEVTVNQEKQRYRSKPVMNVDTTGSSTSIPKPLTYDYMPEGYPKKDGWAVEWDGNTEGKTYIEEINACKISDTVLSVDDLLSATITFPNTPGETTTIPSDNIQVMSDDIIRIFDPISIVVVRKDNAGLLGITFSEKGVYTRADAGTFKMTTENITPMSSDFMPSNYPNEERVMEMISDALGVIENGHY